MRQREGQWIRYRFNIAAQLGGQELSWSAIQAECWGSLVFANVFKEFDHAEPGQKSWLLKMAACPFHLWGRRNFAAKWICINNTSEKLFFLLLFFLKSLPFSTFYIKQMTPAHCLCFYTSIVVIFTTFCWSCKMLVAFMENQWTAQIW